MSMPTDKIEELYASLTKKNAEIYVQRSKQMKRQSPMRTRLFAWCMSDVQLIALADPSLHGKENVVNIMMEIDPDRLVCRRVTFIRGFILMDFSTDMLLTESDSA